MLLCWPFIVCARQLVSVPQIAVMPRLRAKEALLLFSCATPPFVSTCKLPFILLCNVTFFEMCNVISHLNMQRCNMLPIYMCCTSFF